MGANLLARRIAARPCIRSGAGARALLLCSRVGRACTESTVAFPNAIAERIDARCARSHACEALAAGEAVLARLALAARKAAVTATADARAARARIATAGERSIGAIAAGEQRRIGIVLPDLFRRFACSEDESDSEGEASHHTHEWEDVGLVMIESAC